MATTNRFSPGANQDNTLITVTQDYKTPAYAAAITLTTSEEKTKVLVAQLTGALTLNMGVGGAGVAPFIGDTCEILFSSDANVGGRIVTMGTGIAATAATQTIAASKFGSLKLMFNGTTWVEVSRSVTA